MTPISVDETDLRTRGFAIVPGALSSATIDELHATMGELDAALRARHGVPARHPEPLVDLLRRGGAYRTQMFSLLKNLHVVQRTSFELVERLRSGGLWTQMGMRVPLAWPTLRVDPPGEDSYLLPMHQDYGSTRCQTALRGWVPLTPASEDRGTMRVVVGSHALGPLAHDMSNPARPFVPPDRVADLPIETLACEAGTLVLFHPCLVHGSVAGRGQFMKIVLLLQLQDLATMVDPDDPDDPLRPWLDSAGARARAAR